MMSAERSNEMTTISYRAEIFREDDLYVARCPDLDVSSFGNTLEEARDSLQEAIEAFLEGCEMLGTLDAVMAESSYSKVDEMWDLDRPTAEKAALAMLFVDTI